MDATTAIEMGIAGVLLVIVLWCIVSTMRDALKKGGKPPVQDTPFAPRTWQEDDAGYW